MLLPKHEMHVLGGAPQAGKTTFLLQALKAWEEKKDFPITFEATQVAYVISDRDLPTQKIKEIGLKGVEFYSIRHNKELKKPGRLRNPDFVFQEVMKGLKSKFDLLILDPFIFFLGVDPRQFFPTAERMFILGSKAEDMGITIIGVHHSSKSRTDYDYKRPQDRLLGSTAISGFSSCQLMLIEGLEQKKDFDTLSIVSHHAPREEYNLQKDDKGWFKILNNSSVEPSDETFLDMLPLEPFSTKRAIRQGDLEEMSRSTVFRYLDILVSKGLLKKLERGEYQRVIQ